MGTAAENRVRGGKRSNRYPLLLLMIFVAVVAVTTLISIHIPLSFNEADSDQTNSSSGTWKMVLRRREGKGKTEDPYTPILPDSYSSSGWSRNWVKRMPGEATKETFYCERSHIRTDVCHMHGLVQLVGNSSFVLNAVETQTPVAEELIVPYTRKWEKPCMEKVQQIILRSQYGANSNMSQFCEIRHKVPAVIFSTGGYTGNVYHEFNDGLIPLYITSQHLKGEVVFVIVDYHEWWMLRYKEVIARLSKYGVIDIANHTASHCFSDITAGLYIHEELGIDHSLMPKHESTQDFRAVLSDAYSLDKHLSLKKDFPRFMSTKSPESGKVPQLVIIHREGSRAIINLDQVVELATRSGFDVTVLQPDPTTEMKKIFWLLDRCDVLIGVHGAALTHFLFMRPGKIFIQIVPLGTDWAAKTYYGDPAKRFGLRYVEYKITIGESTLSSEYQKNDPILVNPSAVGQQGWSVIKEIYLGKQKVDLSLPRFYKVLAQARAQCDSLATPSRAHTFGGRYPHGRHGSPPSESRESFYLSQRDKQQDLSLSKQRHGLVDRRM